MAKYSQGVKFEYVVRDVMIASGYYVMRSAGSKGIVDLVAWKNGDVVLIQCKKTGKKMKYKDATESLMRLQVADPSWRKQLWVKDKLGVRVFNVNSSQPEMFYTRAEIRAMAKGKDIGMRDTNLIGDEVDD